MEAIYKERKLHLSVVEGRSLPVCDVLYGTSDPYCKISLGNIKHKTSIIYNTLNPVWNEEFTIPITDDSKFLVLSVWDRDAGKSDDFIGTVELPASSFFPILPQGQTQTVTPQLKLNIKFIQPSSTLPEGRLNVGIVEAKDVSDSVKDKCFVQFTFGDQKESIHPSSTSPQLKWEKSFNVPVPLTNSEDKVEVVLYRQSKHGKKKPFGHCKIMLSDLLGSNETMTSWYTLCLTNSKHTNLGDLRLKLHYSEYAVLKDKDWAPMVDLIKNYARPLVELIEYITDERDVYARAFVNVMESHGGLVPFLHKLIAGDVSRNKDEATLFRGNSICTASIEYYFRLIGGDYLRNTLSTFIAKIKREKKETDFVTAKKADDSIQAWKTMVLYAEELVDILGKSEDALPRQMREVLHHIGQIVDGRFEKPHVTVLAQANFLFLRFIIPALCRPKQFGLVENNPKRKLNRTLTLLGKILGNACNGTPFNEPIMKMCNQFVKDKHLALQKFISSASSGVGASPIVLPNHVIDMDQEHSFLYNLFQRDYVYIQEIEAKSEEQDECESQLAAICAKMGTLKYNASVSYFQQDDINNKKLKRAQTASVSNLKRLSAISANIMGGLTSFTMGGMPEGEGHQVDLEDTLQEDG